MRKKRGLVWVRRNLRLHDNTALSKACSECDEVFIVFIFDRYILGRLKESDARVSFIHGALESLENDMPVKKALRVLEGNPEDLIPHLASELEASAVYAHRDYGPYPIKRDGLVKGKLESKNIEFIQDKDHVIFDRHDVLTNDGRPYRVFTPYKNKWLELAESQNWQAFEERKSNLKKLCPHPKHSPLPTLNEMGFKRVETSVTPSEKVATQSLKKFAETVIDSYDNGRDYPSLNQTSRLSPYFRFGLIGPRQAVRLIRPKLSLNGANIWLSELVWRDFYMMVLDHFPWVATRSAKEEYEKIKWPENQERLDLWKKGLTGVPIVDAGMRELNTTGLMHNRVRMITASFLCKILLVDWREGEKYFAEKLLDFDLAANNGGWQWSASTGHDAQPYFRIFNPYTQSKKFDAKGEYIKRYIPELANVSEKDIHRPEKIPPLERVSLGAEKYPGPCVVYEDQRPMALDLYKKGLGKDKKITKRKMAL